VCFWSFHAALPRVNRASARQLLADVGAKNLWSRLNNVTVSRHDYYYNRSYEKYYYGSRQQHRAAAAEVRCQRSEIADQISKVRRNRSVRRAVRPGLSCRTLTVFECKARSLTLATDLSDPRILHVLYLNRTLVGGAETSIARYPGQLRNADLIGG